MNNFEIQQKDESLECSKKSVRNGLALTFLNKADVKQNNARGITLIALVVSIIVLLILARSNNKCNSWK